MGVTDMNKLVSFLKEESGASAAEYALILAIVGVGIVAATVGLRDAISTAIKSAANCVSNTGTITSTSTSC
jgi:pilus assembly protein Flp/PilA